MRGIELISRDPAAWTAILQERAETDAVVVRHVRAVSLGDGFTRYFLTLKGHSDPITLIGKRTTPTEAAFYRDFSARLGFLAPRCWYSYVDEERGWVVMEDVPNDRPPRRWGDRDVERVVGNLAALHIACWNRVEDLRVFDWLPWRLWPMGIESSRSRKLNAGLLSLGDLEMPASHALASAGPLIGEFERAARCLERLQQGGPWPGVIEQEHIDALADLLDDPVPMLYPLRSLPSTLLHGEPGLRHWRLTLFGDCNLLDWRTVCIGPSLCDLVSFIEDMERVHTLDAGRQPREVTQLRAETIVDTYLLRLYEALWPLFNAREVRKAMPAAHCLYIITHWLPILDDWVAPLSPDNATPAYSPRITEQQLRQAGRLAAVRYRPYLTDLFQRFLHAYRNL
ncbi:MAG: phosphotransferase [Anaerolineales bacterium]|nr:phosphotransferase [Anaerolineales bacterium]MCB8952490.1 phosphotransferase [Ardenticatenales bacterium]